MNRSISTRKDIDNVTYSSTTDSNMFFYDDNRKNSKTQQIKLRRGLLNSNFVIPEINLEEKDIKKENDILIPEQPNIPLITYKEAYNYFLKNIHNISAKPIQKSSNNDNCCSCLSGNLSSNLKIEKYILINLSRVKYDMNNDTHFRILFTIYYFFTKKNCPKVGEHWQDIGLQSDDVGTDLLTIGMLSPLQMLYALDKYPKFLYNLYKYLSLRQCELYFGTDMINFTKFVLNMIERGILDYYFKEYNQVTNIANEIFIGMAYNFSYEIQQYGSKNELTIEFIVKTIQKISEIKNQPNYFIRNHNKEV